MKKKALNIVIGSILLLIISGCGKQSPASTESAEQTTAATEKSSESTALPEGYTPVSSVDGISFYVESSVFDSECTVNPDTKNADTFSLYALTSSYEFEAIQTLPFRVEKEHEFVYTGDTSAVYAGKLDQAAYPAIDSIDSVETLQNAFSSFNKYKICNLSFSSDDSFILEDNLLVCSCTFSSASGSMSGIFKLIESNDGQYIYMYGCNDDSTPAETMAALADGFKLNDQSSLSPAYTPVEQAFDVGGKRVTLYVPDFLAIDTSAASSIYPNDTPDGSELLYYTGYFTADEYYGVSLGYVYNKLPITGLTAEESMIYPLFSPTSSHYTESTFTDATGNNWTKLQVKSEDTSTIFKGLYVTYYVLVSGDDSYIFTLAYPSDTVVDYESLFEQGLTSVVISDGESEPYTLNTEFATILLDNFSYTYYGGVAVTPEENARSVELTKQINRIITGTGTGETSGGAAENIPEETEEEDEEEDENAEE